MFGALNDVSLKQKQDELTRKQHEIKTFTDFFREYEIDNVKAKKLGIAFVEEENDFDNVLKLVKMIRCVEICNLSCLVSPVF